jgi:hypothetical protein
VRAARLFTFFLLAFGATTLAAAAAAHGVPAWVKVAAALPDLIAKTLGL